MADGWELGDEAVAVVVYPHERDGRPVIQIASGTRHQIKGGFDDLKARIGPDL